MKKISFLLAAVCLFAGCGGYKLDASNEAAFKQSADKMRSVLPHEQREKFDSALLTIAADNQVNQNNISAADLLEASQAVFEQTFYSQSFLDKVHKKTYRQIVAQAKRITNEYGVRGKKELMAKIWLLEQKKAASQAAQKEMEKLIIKNAKLYVKSPASIPERVLEFDMENKTGKTISRFTAKGVITEPDKSNVPLFEGVITYTIGGDLADGESKHFAISPDIFGWTDAVTGGNTEFALKIIKVYDINGLLMWDNSFDKNDEDNLGKLKGELAEIYKHEKGV